MSQPTTNDTKSEPPVWDGKPCRECGSDRIQAVEEGVVTLCYAEIAPSHPGTDAKMLYLSQHDTIYDGCQLTQYLECSMCLTQYSYPDLEIEYV